MTLHSIPLRTHRGEKNVAKRHHDTTFHSIAHREEERREAPHGPPRREVRQRRQPVARTDDVAVELERMRRETVTRRGEREAILTRNIIEIEESRGVTYDRDRYSQW